MIANEYDELDRELGQMTGERMSPGGGGGGLRMLPIAIGVVSLLALGGIVWYAYSQGVREGSEVAAPVLRVDSPAKVAPEDRGGREIAGTDLDVYDRLSGTGSEDSSERVERILPPPEEPKVPVVATEGTGGTVTGTAVLSEAPREPVAPATPGAATRPAIPTPTAPQPTAEAPTAAPPAPALAAPAAPPPTAGTTTQSVAAAAAEQGAGAITPPPSAAPPAAPAAPEPPAPVQQAAAPAAPTAPPAATAGAGWRIQLAALRTDAAARAEWQKRQSANPDLLGSLALEVQQATVNGTQYFRVRGGPLADKAAASALCTRLKAANVACIPVAPGR